MIFILNDNRFFLHNPTRFKLIYSYEYARIDYLVDLLSYRLSESHTFGTVWQHRHVLPLITDELSLLVNCRVKLTGTSREDCAGSTTLVLKLGGSAPSSGPFWLAACDLGTEMKILCRHTFLARPVGPHNRHDSSQQRQHPYGTL